LTDVESPPPGAVASGTERAAGGSKG
jgi:hypothetical protein